LPPGGDPPGGDDRRVRIVVATEALASGMLTRRDLARGYVKLHRNVYARKGVELTAYDRVRAAWLWSGRQATMVGPSAAVLLGSKWIPADAPVELTHPRRPAARGILARADRIGDDEICRDRRIHCTTTARTAYDLGRRLPLEAGVIRIDALLNATGAGTADVDAIARRYPGARGIRQLRSTLDLVDGGAESPQETRLRLLLVHAGLPRPLTQIPVLDDAGQVARRLDMGWPNWLVAAEYDGEHHWTNARQYAEDIVRQEFIASRGWTLVRVSAVQLRRERAAVIERVRTALRRAGWPD